MRGRLGRRQCVEVVCRGRPVGLIVQTQLLGLAPGDLLIDPIACDAPDIPQGAAREPSESKKKSGRASPSVISKLNRSTCARSIVLALMGSAT